MTAVVIVRKFTKDVPKAYQSLSQNNDYKRKQFRVATTYCGSECTGCGQSGGNGDEAELHGEFVLATGRERTVSQRRGRFPATGFSEKAWCRW